MSQTIPLIVSIPHSGEKVPDITPWLKVLPEKTLMSDVDRYVNLLYESALNELNIVTQQTEWHRYAVDLNRIPEDVDESSVVGAPKKAGSHSDGYHWVKTKGDVVIMPQPMSQEVHRKLTELIYEPFHAGLRNHYENYRKQGHQNIFHIDAHSMPSKGGKNHRDPGETRADIVVSDCNQKSCHRHFKDLVIAAYTSSGFKVAYNWPYLGGRVTEQYGKPKQGQQAIQVELNRGLYMDEVTKQLLPQHKDVQIKIQKALTYIKSELPKLDLSE